MFNLHFKPNNALKPTRFRYAPAVGLALRWASLQTTCLTFTNRAGGAVSKMKKSLIIFVFAWSFVGQAKAGFVNFGFDAELNSTRLNDDTYSCTGFCSPPNVIQVYDYLGNGINPDGSYNYGQRDQSVDGSVSSNVSVNGFYEFNPSSPTTTDIFGNPPDLIFSNSEQTPISSTFTSSGFVA